MSDRIESCDCKTPHAWHTWTTDMSYDVTCPGVPVVAPMLDQLDALLGENTDEALRILGLARVRD